MKKNIIFLIAAFLMIVSCKNSNENSYAEASEDIYAESIFQLNSDWEDQNSNQIKLAELQGRAMVVAMIYTSCKTACPRLTAEMREIERGVGDYDPDKIRFVLVSIDPEVDTPNEMKVYLENNKFEEPQWLFLRSDDAGTREFANVLSVKYKQISPVDFSHSNIISVFSKEGVLTYQKEGLSNEVDDVVEEIQKVL